MLRNPKGEKIEDRAWRKKVKSLATCTVNLRKTRLRTSVNALAGDQSTNTAKYHIYYVTLYLAHGLLFRHTDIAGDQD